MLQARAARSARGGQAGPRGPRARPVAARAGAPAAARELVAGVAREHRDEVAAVVERARRAADQWEVRLGRSRSEAEPSDRETGLDMD